MAFIADLLQNVANTAHNVGINTPELGWTESAGGSNVSATYKLPDTGKVYTSPSGALSGRQQIGNKIYDFSGQNVSYVSDVPSAGGGASPTGATQEQLDQTAYNNQQAAQTAYNTAGERAAYDDQISNLDKLLGFAATKRQQGMQGIEDQYNQTRGQQEQIFNNQRTQNTQNQEKGYNEVGNFANTSNNNLQRLLQGANAGRSSVGQVLAPYMVGRAADTRRQAVTNTAGENAANIDTTATTTFQDLQNQRKKNLSDYENSIGNTQQELEQQKIDAIRARDMANGQTYAQTIANTQGLTNSMDSRRNALADLFNKYKPDYSVAKAPELSTYQVDPAQIKAGQNTPGASDFYLNQLKKRKELGN